MPASSQNYFDKSSTALPYVGQWKLRQNAIMTFTPENIFFLGSVLIFASIVINKWGYRFGVPT